MSDSIRRPQVSILGIAEPGLAAYALAGDAGALLAQLGVTNMSGLGRRMRVTRVLFHRTVP